MREFVETYLQDLTLLCSEITTGRQTKDLRRLHRAAHTIKSNALEFGATKLGQLARELEMLAGSDSPAQDKLDSLSEGVLASANAVKQLVEGKLSF